MGLERSLGSIMTIRSSYPTPANNLVSKRMIANPRTNTRPERRVRSAMHKAGLRFRVNHPLRVQGLLVRPDIVFPRVRLAVFIDGCFWHVCPSHGTRPRHNSQYWSRKLARNRERDKEVDSALTEADWMVLRFWEHEAPDAVAAYVSSVLERIKRNQRRASRDD